MKSLILSLCSLVLLLVIVSCGTTVKVSDDYDKSVNFSGYKTFGIYDLKTKVGQVNPLNVDRITNSIKAEMTSKGFTESATPDLMVNAVAIVKDKTSVSASSNYYG